MSETVRDPAGAAAAGPVLHCYRHPRRSTGVRCVRCERPICPDCMRPAAVGFQCPDDAGRAARSTRRPVTAVGARVGSRRAYLTWTLIAANIAVYLVTALSAVRGINSPYGSRLFADWEMQPSAVNAGQYYRLITSAFLHTSLLHLAMNMFALGVVGPYLEPVLGRWRYLAVYLLSALGGSVAVYLFGSFFGPVASASGAIFGLFAAALLLARETGLDPQWLLGTLVLNFVLTFTVPDISWLGHLGGFVAGFASTVAVAGPPGRGWLTRGYRARRVPLGGLRGLGGQVAGIGTVAVVLVALIAWRTATV